MTNLSKGIQEMYLDYVNNFLSLSGFASFYGLREDVAEMIIELGRKVMDDKFFDN